MKLKETINAIIFPGEQRGYVAECLKISVVTQGETLDEVVRNLQEAVALHLEDEDPAEFGSIAKYRRPRKLVLEIVRSRNLPKT